MTPKEAIEATIEALIVAFDDPSVSDDTPEDEAKRIIATKLANVALTAAAPFMLDEVKALREALLNIAEGNLGDSPWQASYDRIRSVARRALDQTEAPE
jgi:hypothetical protein